MVRDSVENKGRKRNTFQFQHLARVLVGTEAEGRDERIDCCLVMDLYPKSRGDKSKIIGDGYVVEVATKNLT